MSIIERYSAAVNQLLPGGETGEQQIYEEFAREHAGSQEALYLLQRAHEAFVSAVNPSDFFTSFIAEPNAYFEAFYALLGDTFPPEERLPRDRFLQGFAPKPLDVTSAQRILMGRYWQTSGPQQYMPDGSLQHFAYDPYVISQHIVGLIAGNYIPIVSAYPSPDVLGMGAISYIATRPLFRRGYGHGRKMVEAFENEIRSIGSSQGRTVSLFFVEASAGAPGFWSQCGYRWPENVYYAQPPIDFDKQTGEPEYPEVPETLMVKLAGDMQEIDSNLLIEVVKSIYREWYLRWVETITTPAAERARSYIMQKVFQEFLDSLPRERSSIPLKTLSS